MFVNYDGVAKHRTQVGDQVRIGSDTMLVAPVEIGDGAYTAAGSVITENVPPGALGSGRAEQRNIPGWVARRRPGTSSAAAAAAQSEQARPEQGRPEQARSEQARSEQAPSEQALSEPQPSRADATEPEGQAE